METNIYKLEGNKLLPSSIVYRIENRRSVRYFVNNIKDDKVYLVGKAESIPIIEFLTEYKYFCDRKDINLYKTTFKNRGHFCNYCRKIISKTNSSFNHNNINQAIWYVWNMKNKRISTCFLKDLYNLRKYKHYSLTDFNLVLKNLTFKFIGYDTYTKTGYKKKKKA